MISIKRAAGDGFQYPCTRELIVMAKRLIEYYPMLRDKSAASGAEWVSHESGVHYISKHGTVKYMAAKVQTSDTQNRRNVLHPD